MYWPSLLKAMGTGPVNSRYSAPVFTSSGLNVIHSGSVWALTNRERQDDDRHGVLGARSVR